MGKMGQPTAPPTAISNDRPILAHLVTASLLFPASLPVLLSGHGVPNHLPAIRRLGWNMRRMWAQGETPPSLQGMHALLAARSEPFMHDAQVFQVGPDDPSRCASCGRDELDHAPCASFVPRADDEITCNVCGLSSETHSQHSQEVCDHYLLSTTENTGQCAHCQLPEERHHACAQFTSKGASKLCVTCGLVSTRHKNYRCTTFTPGQQNLCALCGGPYSTHGTNSSPTWRWLSMEDVSMTTSAENTDDGAAGGGRPHCKAIN